jgi:hypothetical protein
MRAFSVREVSRCSVLNLSSVALNRPPSAAEAFAAKYMPDLGQEIEDFQVQTWRISGWSQSSKRLVGADFGCGGHKWYVSTGASSSSLKATPTGNQTTWCRSTSTTPTPNQHQRAGTPAPSSPSRSRIPTILPSSPSLVIPPFPAHLRRRVAEPHRHLTPQMLTTGLSTRSAIGASPALPTSGSFTPRKRVTLARRLRETRWMSRPLCGY